MQYSTFDIHAEIHFTRGRLPHWGQAGAFHFITFHTADSLPRAASAKWHDDRSRWLASRGIDATCPNWERRFDQLPVKDRREFSRRFSKTFGRLLDEGHGPCWLRSPDLRAFVAEALLHGNDQHYVMDAFVVMPNHVHALVGLHEPGALKRHCRSWKHYTATRINARLGRRGPFWQSESWDHLVRSVESFERIRRYIEANPRNAGLGPGAYTVYRRAEA